MKRTICTLLAALMFVSVLPFNSNAASYKEVYIGKNIYEASFNGDICVTNVNSDGLSNPAVIDINGNIIAQYKNGNIFLQTMPDGTYYYNFYTFSGDVNDVYWGNVRTGTKPVKLPAANGILSGNNDMFDQPAHCDYAVLTHNGEYPFKKYLYGPNGKQVFDQPIKELHDIGTAWLEMKLEDDSIIYINRNTWETSKNPDLPDTERYTVFSVTDKDHRVQYGIKDAKGSIVIPAEYDRISLPENGVIRAAKRSTGISSSLYYGLIDLDGNVICDFKYSYITAFSNGIAAYKTGWMTGGFIDSKGNVLISDCDYFDDSNSLGEYNVYSKPTYDPTRNDNDGYDLFTADGYRLTHKFYDCVGPFNEGLAPVLLDNGNDCNYKLGFIDTLGNEVIPCIYDPAFVRRDQLSYFSNGRIILQKGSKSYIVHNPLMTNGISAPKNNASVMVDGKIVSVDAYTINGNNYFKLRDVAMMLSGSKKQFNVSWNSAKDCVEIEQNKPYSPVGGELVKTDKTKASAKFYLPLVFCNGGMVNEFTAYYGKQTYGLKAYLIDSNNYFKLRDLGEFLDFYVGWDGINKVISIDTSRSYNG